MNIIKPALISVSGALQSSRLDKVHTSVSFVLMSLNNILLQKNGVYILGSTCSLNVVVLV